MKPILSLTSFLLLITLIGVRPIFGQQIECPSVVNWGLVAIFPLNDLGAHTADVNAVVWSPDETLIASGSNDRTVKIWDFFNQVGTLLQTLTGPELGVSSLAWSPDGLKLAAGTCIPGGAGSRCTYSAPLGKIFVWTRPNAASLFDQTPFVLEDMVGSTISVDFSPDSLYIAYSVRQTGFYPSASVRVVRAEAGSQPTLSTQPPCTNANLTQISWSPAPNIPQIAGGMVNCDMGGGSRTVRTWNDQNLGLTHIRDYGPAHLVEVWSVKYSPAGAQIAAGSASSSTGTGFVDVYTIPFLNPSVMQGQHEGPVNSLSWCPAGTLLASAGAPGVMPSTDQSIRIWNVATREQVQIFDGPYTIDPTICPPASARGVFSIAWSPSTFYIVSGGCDFKVRLWGDLGQGLRRRR